MAPHGPIVIGIAAGRRDGEVASALLRTILEDDTPYEKVAVVGGLELFDGAAWERRPNLPLKRKNLAVHRAHAAEKGLPFLVVELGSGAEARATEVGGVHVDMRCTLGAGGAGTVRIGSRGLSFSARSPIADVGVSNASSGFGLLRFCAHTPSWSGNVALPMTGTFNIGPALAAITVCETLGMGHERVANSLLHARASAHGGLYGAPDQSVFALVEESPEAQDGSRLTAAARHDYEGFSVQVVRGAEAVEPAVARAVACEGRTMLVLLDAPAEELEDAFQAAARQHARGVLG